MKEAEWETYQDNINVVFSNENLFIEKMKTELFKNKIENWDSFKSAGVGGTVFSFRELIKRCFGLTDAEIDEQMESIESEKKSHKFDLFYKIADLEIGNEYGLTGQMDAEGNPAKPSDLAPGLFIDKDEFEDGDSDEEGYDEESPEEESSDDETSGAGGFDITDHSSEESGSLVDKLLKL
jgi:hypothetical protein